MKLPNQWVFDYFNVSISRAYEDCHLAYTKCPYKTSYQTLSNGKLWQHFSGSVCWGIQLPIWNEKSPNL